MTDQAERVSIPIYVPGGTPCEAQGQPNTDTEDGTRTGCKIFYLENFTDYVLPNPTYIVGTEIWIDGVNPLGPMSGSPYGNIPFLVDPQRSYEKASGFPVKQHAQVFNWKNIGTLQLFPNGTQVQSQWFEVPVAYRSGDIICMAPEANTTSSSPSVLTTFFTVHIQSSQGDFTSWPTPLTPLDLPSTTPVGGQSPVHLRMLVPPSTFHASKIRAHMKSPFTQTALENITHMSVGLQSGSGPNMQATPVQLTINTLDGVSFGAGNGAWTDWINFDIPAGQPVLVAGSLWTPGNTNSWAVTYSSGLGSWYSFTADSWNQVTMGGSDVTFQPGVTHLIDKVQVQISSEAGASGMSLSAGGPMQITSGSVAISMV